MAQLNARRHEASIYLASHPFVFVLVELLRQVGGVVRLPGLGVAVSGALAVRGVLDDEEHFSKSGPGSAGVFYEQVMGRRALMNMDGAEHLALRRRIGDLFTPAYLKVVAHEVIAPSLLVLETELREGRTIELVRFTRLLTGRMICHQLGVRPEAGREDATYLEMFDLGERLIGNVRITTRSLSGRDLEQARATFGRLMAIARETYGDGEREDSMVARLRSAGLEMDEVEAVMASLFLAGTQTVSTALPRLVALLVDTKQLPRLHDEPTLIQGAIDEGLRLTVPTPVTLRRAIAPVTIEGHRFQPGDRVLVLTCNATKDARLFPAPLTFDIERRQPAAVRNLWFGAGQHFCLGYALAQFEIRWVLESLLRVGGEFEIVERRAARHVLIPCYQTLGLRRRAS